MNRTQVDVAVGAFVVSAIGLLLWGTLAVSRVPDWLGSDAPTFSARFDSVSGLSEEARVSIAGVSVGKVSKIVLDRSRALVTVRLEDDSVEIPIDSIVRIRSRGLLGEKVLEVVPGESPILLESGGVLTRTRSTRSVDELADRLTAVADDLHRVSTTFRNVLGGAEGEEAVREVLANSRALTGMLRRMVEENDERIEGIARNLESFSSDLAAFSAENRDSLGATVEQFRAASERLGSAVDHLAEVSGRLERGEGTIGKLLSDDELYENLDGLLKEARAAVTEVRRAAEETQEQIPATILTTLMGSLF